MRRRPNRTMIQNTTRDSFDLTLVPKPSIERADLDNV
jgi:hypothetical protein